jgi:hypothetical protein
VLKATQNGMARKLGAANRVVVLLMSEPSKHVFLGPPGKRIMLASTKNLLALFTS